MNEHISEEILWDIKQLGNHSPFVLLSTLMYFNTRVFRCYTVEDHMKLSFTNVVKVFRKVPRGCSARFLRLKTMTKDAETVCEYEQVENRECPARCPLNLYEFYLSKCPDYVRCRSDVYYMMPERHCVLGSPVWYSSQPLGRDMISKMLTRFTMVNGMQDLATTLFQKS